MIKFHDWLKQKIEESSAFTRTRRAAALGLGPSIPKAERNSHSTLQNPAEIEGFKKQDKKSKKKRKKKKD